MSESTANQVLAIQADAADKERARVAAWAARNQPRQSVYVRPSLFARVLRAIGF